MSNPDLILVGGGLANTLIALRLAVVQPQLKLLLLEQGDCLGGNHTWSFHGSDISESQLQRLQPLIQYSWTHYDVRFPERTRQLSGSYHSITSEQLNNVAQEKLAGSIRTNQKVASIHADGVVLDDGQHLPAAAVLDGRGPTASPHLDVRFQKFVGRVVKLASPHELSGPIIMDATSTQDDGYRFFYTLPFDAHTVLIEDTRYSDTPEISTTDYGNAINEYANQQGWRIESILREEDGILPITLGGDIDAFWDDSPEPIGRTGLRAALFHPATGYSLPNAVALADQLAEQLTTPANWSTENVYKLTRAASVRLWHTTGFYRKLNRMLFLAAEPAERRHVLQRFYGLKAGLISRFYAGTSTRLDKLRILLGKPPVKLGRAFDAVFRYRPASAAGDATNNEPTQTTTL